MKRIQRTAAIMLILCSLLFATVVSAASGFKTVHTNSSWKKSERTVNGAVFTSDYNSATSASRLRVTLNGKTKTLTNYSNGGCVISDGSTVYHCIHKNGSYLLYQTNLKTGHSKKIRKIGGSSVYNIELAGRYGKNIYYIQNLPEGKLMRINLSNKKLKAVPVSGKTVSMAKNIGRYFLITDGTGAGYSYLGCFNAATYKFSYISKAPYTWTQNSKYVYYAEIKSGDRFSNPNITVKRYTLSNGKKKTLVSSLKVNSVTKITSKYIEYYDEYGSLQTRWW